jgi:hypothetical protein
VRWCRGGEVIPRPVARSKLRLGARTRPRGGIRSERRLGSEHGRGRRKARGKAWSKGTAASTGWPGRSTAWLLGCSRVSARGARRGEDGTRARQGRARVRSDEGVMQARWRRSVPTGLVLLGRRHLLLPWPPVEHGQRWRGSRAPRRGQGAAAGSARASPCVGSG